MKNIKKSETGTKLTESKKLLHLVREAEGENKRYKITGGKGEPTVDTLADAIDIVKKMSSNAKVEILDTKNKDKKVVYGPKGIALAILMKMKED